MGGTIEVDSELGKGTTFSIFLSAKTKLPNPQQELDKYEEEKK